MGEKLLGYGVDKALDHLSFKTNFEALQRNLQLLSARASDIEDQLNKPEQSGKKKRKREVENWLTDVKSMQDQFLELENEVRLEGYVRRFIGGDREVKLNQTVVELIEQSRHFGGFLLDVDGKIGHELLTKRLVGEAFEKNVETIWRLLVIDKVPSVGIYGMGGVGKTTLTKHIHNKLLKETQEDINVLWVTVSQVWNINKLQDEVALVLDIKLSDKHDEDKRASSLYRALSQRKNFVLILDDVWEKIDLQKVGDPLRVEGGRLMITTRSLEVCRQIDCTEIIEVKTLHEGEAWELFSEIFGQKMTVLSPEIQEVAKSMAKVCDGLPLGIITVAGGMKGETDVRVWRAALAQLKDSVMGQYEMEDKVFKVLKYSFDRLDPYHQRQGRSNGYTELQHCFLYCSLYPEDLKIKRDELITTFISEGLVGKGKRVKEQLDKGHSILKKLENLCLLEGNDTDYVKMHDLVRAMALRITQGKTMVIAGDFSLKKIPNEGEWTEDLEKVSLMYNGIEEIPAGISPNCPKLSTLLLLWNQRLHYVADSFFSQMHGLCTLDLSYTGFKKLPDSLSNLESLKALILHSCMKLEYVPYLGKLKGLKHLDLSFTGIRQVPQGMEKLVNLKWLLMRGARKLETLPRGMLLNFRYLQLLILPDKIEAPADEMERLEELEEFQGRFKDVCDFNRFIRSRQSKGVSASYDVLVGEKPKVYKTEEMKNCKEVLLYQYNFKKGEEKEVAMLAHDIQHLQLEECEGLSKCLLDEVNNPKSFETLTIEDCEGIECIMGNEELMGAQELSTPPPQAIFASLKVLSIWECEKMKKLGIPVSEIPNIESVSVSCCDEIEEIIQVAEEDDHVSLPKLKNLYLSDLPNLKSICNATMICTSIQQFVLWSCPALKKVQLCFTRDVVHGQPYSPPPGSEFQNLEILTIRYCPEIEEIIQVADDNGRGEGEAYVSLPKLKMLELIDLPRLKSVCKATMTCSSIEKIMLRGCPSLNKVPLYFPRDVVNGQVLCSPPPALKEIRLLEEEREWWESLEWDHSSHEQLLQPFLQFKSPSEFWES